MLLGLATFAGVIRSVLLGAGIVVAVIAAADWAARTRRISPFSGMARFLRGTVDPRIAGIERQVVRAGGHPSATPMWALVAFVVVAALVIAAIDMIARLGFEIMYALAGGGAGVLFLLVRWTFAVLQIALMVRVLSSWFPRAAHSRWLRWSYGATEWMLRPLRRVIPSFGSVDITPIIAYFLLQLVGALVTGALFPGRQ